ncbi:SH3 domain-containing protein, partial [Flavobacteriales bacterium]|nr:SH3 domain-containing protein [Flavobacteriales bacterium]
NTKEIIENNCDVNPDYIMKAENFIPSVENEKDYRKYEDKIVRISINHDDLMTRICVGGTCEWGSRSIQFHFNNWPKSYEDYNDYLFGEHSDDGYIGGRIKIQGTYNGDGNLKDCCWLIPRKRNQKETNKSKSNITKKESILYGEINDPDGYTNVREEKSSKSEIVFKVYQGEEFEIIDNRDDNWWLIEYDGEQGYIYSDRIDIIK